MQILLNTDNHIRGDARTRDYVELAVRQGLGHLSEHLTRVDVHLKDVNAGKGGDGDKHCTIEARPEGLAPLAVTAQAGSLADAIDAATDKMFRALDSALGKRADH